jgi:hypothetical protein
MMITSEAFVAARTFVVFLPGVRLLVILQNMFVAERFAAHFALEGFASRRLFGLSVCEVTER